MWRSACAYQAFAVSAAIRLTNEVGLAPVSNRVLTCSDEELLIVEMQHLRYIVLMSVSSQSHAMRNKACDVYLVREADGLVLVA